MQTRHERVPENRSHVRAEIIATQTTSRVRSVDALRGLVMIVMALDHVRDFFHADAMYFQPDNLARTTVPLFFTRWITHFCAPVFVFTAGAAAFFWLNRGRTKPQLTRFLWQRGLWLVLLELTVVRLAMTFSLSSGIVILEVIWVIGWSMVALGVLIYLPVRILAALSIGVIALHNMTDFVMTSQFGFAGWIWNLLHQPGVLPVGRYIVLVAYPLIPWIAVMAAGFSFGNVVTLDPPQRRQWMIRIGLGITLAFFVIRGMNVYGDPQPWSSQVPGMTVLSFLRCAKYPPSLDFLLMTLGPAILLLARFDQMKFAPSNPLIVFGRVPLFYFIVHLYLIHSLAILLAFFRYGSGSFLLNPLPSMGGQAKLYPPHYGYQLGIVYVLWITVVALMYPLSLWFSRLKDRRNDWWLSYL